MTTKHARGVWLLLAMMVWAGAVGAAFSRGPLSSLPRENATWHKAGHRGQGVTIAVLDSGFKGYREALGGVLPAKVQTKSFRKDGRLEARDSQHGILCAEVIHRVAPDAKLLFANWE